MRNQNGVTLWRQFQKKIWRLLVRAGKRNVLLRMGIMAVTAVYLFCHHLYRKAKSVSALRYACLFCAGMLVLNCARVPARVWALEQEEAYGTNTAPEQGTASGRLDIVITGPAIIVEGYQDTVPYRIQLTNPADGVELNGFEVRTSNFGDVYALEKNEETGAEEEVLVYHHSSEGEETGGNAPGNPEEAEWGAHAPEILGVPEASDEPEGDAQEPEDSDEPEGDTQEPELPESNSGENAPENEGEETSEALDGAETVSLPKGASLTYIMRIPVGLPVGQYTETLIFSADELEPIKRTISFVVESADQGGESTDIPSGGDASDGTTEKDPSDGGVEGGVSGEPVPEEPTEGGIEGGVSGEPVPEEPTEGDTEEGVSGEPVPEEPTEGDTEEGGSGEPVPEEPTEDDTEGELPEEADPSEEEGSEEDDPVQGPRFEVISREGGYYMEDTFFVMSEAVYELKVDASSVAAVFCDLNGVSQELPVADGYASFTVPETYNGTIRFYALGQDGAVVEELTEYLIAERTAPSLDYTNVTSQADGTCAVRVSLEDCGDVISGLNNVECAVDGVLYTGYTPNVFGKVLLCSGKEVISGFSFDIPLQDDEIHTVNVIATDNVGNVLEQSFRVHASQTEVVSVVLPTSFGMTIFPYASNGNIWGEDIVVANQSEFPVEVTLKSTEVKIDHTLPENSIMKHTVPVGNTVEQPIDLTQQPDERVKDAKLNLHLKLFGDRGDVVELQEGYSMPGDCFVLEPENPDTNASLLQSDSSEKTVISGDYAIVNIRGSISEGSESMWKDGDIAVALTFTFRKLEEPADEDVR